jgi:hypothetical protein
MLYPGNHFAFFGVAGHYTQLAVFGFTQSIFSKNQTKASGLFYSSMTADTTLIEYGPYLRIEIDPIFLAGGSYEQ